MNYFFMPMAMWNIFQKSFRNNLHLFNVKNPTDVMKKAKQKYREIIEGIPQYGRNDILPATIMSAATLASIYLSLPEKPDVVHVEEYYRKSMNENKIMRINLKSTKNFSKAYQKKLSNQAEKSQKATNPYTWRFKFYHGDSIDSYDAIFDKCGICELFRHLEIADITPAMCAYDYEMARYTDTVFTREYTLASGGFFRNSAAYCHAQIKLR